MKHLCLVAAKSGGHILPCLTLAQQYQPDYTTFIASQSILDRTITKQPFINKNIYLSLINVPYKKPYLLPIFLGQLFYSWLKMLHYFIANRPEKIVSTGSYVAIPVVFAGFLLRIPIELWELNVVPGKTIKWLTPFATTIKICFKETVNYLKNNKCELASYPLLYTDNDKTSQEKALNTLNFDPKKITLFILGGSQGSQELNSHVSSLLVQQPMLTNKIQIIHQTGSDNLEIMEKFYATHHISAHVFGYKSYLAPFYNAADLVISRAGAGALAELSFFEKETVLIPLIIKENNHQYYNALAKSQESPNTFHTLTMQDDNFYTKTIKLITDIVRFKSL